ncbi:hypothetical protein LFWB_6300 [Candidatus Phytoplasma luffae]|uniref:Uncharacterized protein n=2 Tax=Loofah witches'-broom phytoplasma TaxID=35773 RepID=A0A975FKM7_LOWBP|nr:hypothetical protein LFWB_6300 [Candidatus Phytoplasma luffae]
MNDRIKNLVLKIILPFLISISLILTLFSYKNNSKDFIKEQKRYVPETIFEEFQDVLEEPRKLIDLIQLRNELQNTINNAKLFYDLIKELDSSLVSDSEPETTSSNNIEQKLKENKILQKKISQLEDENKIFKSNSLNNNPNKPASSQEGIEMDLYEELLEKNKKLEEEIDQLKFEMELYKK